MLKFLFYKFTVQPSVILTVVKLLVVVRDYHRAKHTVNVRINPPG